ncbi:MAG TPA: MaoC family dehydratase N-terminal domain-containing protein [Frankiaceae bacterium]|nr:MaoC family dehydratase N-terminal domain-containing protein [Frankiaceae bacterium]
MSLNREFIGRSYESSPPFEIGRELVRHFAAAIGDFNPISHDVEAARAAGHPDLVAPPTFLTTLTFRRPSGPMGDPELGLDYSRVVHGEQRFELHRPVHAGDVVVATSTVAEIRDVGRNEMMQVVSEISTTDGERVATATNTMISRGTAAPKES